MTKLPLRVSYQKDVYVRIFTRRIPEQQYFGIYKGAPILKSGALEPCFLLLSEDQQFAKASCCLNELLRAMEKNQGSLRFTTPKAELKRQAKFRQSMEKYENPLETIRSAV